MSTLIPASASEIVANAQYAGMTQVMNIHSRTILVTDDGKYLRPDECALIDSRSIKMREAIEHGHLLVLNVIDAKLAESKPTTESSYKKKKATVASADESTSTNEAEQTESTSGDQPPAEEVAPEQPEESL